MAGSISESFATATVTATSTVRMTLFPSQTADPFIFPLTTTIPIYVFPTPAPSPFDPEYVRFRDGSLITPLFIDDFVYDKTRLILLGVFAMLFTRNCFIAIDYTIRVRIKRKTLFYFLISSQFCALPAICALLSPFFLESAKCSISVIVAAVFSNLSYTFLVPGILGIKVYRFLERPRIVPIFLGLVHPAALVLSFSDLPNLVSTRKLTGSCLTQGDIPRMVIGVALVVSEILFICFCFAYAVWRASRYPEVRGRTSIRLSLDSERLDEGQQKTERRWWRFSNQQGASPFGVDIGDSKQPCTTRPCRFLRTLMILFGDKELINTPQYVPRKSSAPDIDPGVLRGRNRKSWRSFPRKFHIPDALKNELAYTAAVAVTCAISSSLVIVGLFDERLMGGPLAWVGISWSVTSLLILHNFSRLVRRNERDHILQEPAAWNPIPAFPPMTQKNRPLGAPSQTNTLSFLQSPPQSQTSTLSRNSGPSQQEVVPPVENPFADIHVVPTWTQSSTFSWNGQEKPNLARSTKSTR